MDVDRRPDDLAYVALPRSGTGSPVLVIHSWWGLTGSFFAYADSLAARGFLVGCADLFNGRIATTEAEARALRSVRRREPVYRTLRRHIDELGSLGDGHDPAVVGFSSGGHWAIWLAQHPEPPVRSITLYYAARAGNFSAASAPVLAHFAAHDAFVTPDARQRMERALRANQIPYEGHDYAATQHWFAESEHAAYRPDAAELAFDRTVRFLGVGRSGGVEDP